VVSLTVSNLDWVRRLEQGNTHVFGWLFCVAGALPEGTGPKRCISEGADGGGAAGFAVTATSEITSIRIGRSVILISKTPLNNSEECTHCHPRLCRGIWFWPLRHAQHFRK
jgi:hypothetical protein